MMKSDDYLQMSGIQHFCFCRRQWALAYMEMQWSENLRTAEGRLAHQRCHDEESVEKEEIFSLSGACGCSRSGWGFPELVMSWNSSNLRMGWIYRDMRGLGLPFLWNINMDMRKRTMRIGCSSVLRQWLWKKCWSAIFLKAVFLHRNKAQRTRHIYRRIASSCRENGRRNA